MKHSQKFPHLQIIMVPVFVCGTFIDMVWDSQQQHHILQHVNAYMCKSKMHSSCMLYPMMHVIIKLLKILLVKNIIFTNVYNFIANINQMLRWWTFSP